jgi:GNAT superfamily N-acetyltransferase
MNIPELTSLHQCAVTPAEISRLASVLAEGFADDPVMNWALGSPTPQALMFSLLARHVYCARGVGTLLHEAHVDKAACLWLKPDTSKDLALWPTLRLAASVMRHGGPFAVLRTLKLDARLDDKHPPEPHVYLFAVAVAPGFQGKGLGRRVLKPMLEYCDTNGALAYLENSKARNLPFYRGLGFEVLEELAPGPGCSPLWLMQRKAQ